jgi:hypothetical protein
MRASLSLHPASHVPAVSRIEVDVERRAGSVLELRYRLTGDVGALVLPSPTQSSRADDLWRRTCFEAFVRAGDAEGYCELFFSPSSQWAVYRFSGLRAGMAPAEVPAIAVAAASNDSEIELSASVDLSRVMPAGGLWRLGLSTVVEATGGDLSYWALSHTAERPDFHHPESFVLELPEPA